MSVGTFIVLLIVLFVVSQILLAMGEDSKEVSEGTKDELRQKLEEITHCVSEETHGSRTYWFDSDDGKFLAWGDTPEELIENLKIRFPEHIFYLNKSGEMLCQPTWKPVPFPTGTAKKACQ